MYSIPVKRDKYNSTVAFYYLKSTFQIRFGFSKVMIYAVTLVATKSLPRVLLYLLIDRDTLPTGQRKNFKDTSLEEFSFSPLFFSFLFKPPKFRRIVFSPSLTLTLDTQLYTNNGSARKILTAI